MVDLQSIVPAKTSMHIHVYIFIQFYLVSSAWPTNPPKEHVQQFKPSQTRYSLAAVSTFLHGRIITTEDTKVSVASVFFCYIDTPQSLNNSKAKNMWRTSSTTLQSSPKDPCDLLKKTIAIVWDPNCYGVIWCLPSKCSLGKNTPPV